MIIILIIIMSIIASACLGYAITESKLSCIFFGIMGLVIGVILALMAYLVIDAHYIVLEQNNKTETISTQQYELVLSNDSYLFYDNENTTYSFIYKKDEKSYTEKININHTNIIYLTKDDPTVPYVEIDLVKPENDALDILYTDAYIQFYTFYIPENSIIILIP